ncbi:hypothetical protein AB205_0216260, partial [Aquarana catesbeiana]
MLWRNWTRNEKSLSRSFRRSKVRFESSCRFTSRQLEFWYPKSQSCKQPYRLHSRQHVRK